MSQAQIKKAEFAEMSPYEQGMAVFSQGRVNDEIPSKNPYKRGTDDHKAFERGMIYALKRSKVEV